MPFDGLDQAVGARAAVAVHADVPLALAELRAELAPAAEDLSLIFAEADIPARVLEAGLQASWGDRLVHGATGPWVLGSLPGHGVCVSGLVLPGDQYQCRSVLIDDLRRFDPSAFALAIRQELSVLRAEVGAGENPQMIALLLLDGLGQSEELVTYTAAMELGATDLLGGSVAVPERRRSAYLLRGGEVAANAGTLLLIATKRPIHRFRSCSVRPGPERVVVTEADVRRRLVHELDGMPAAHRLAQLLGCAPGALTAERLARRPFVLGICGRDYARPVLHVERNGALGFGGAIENGVVLRLGESGAILADTRDLLAEHAMLLGSAGAVLAFDSLLRWQQLEAAERPVYAKLCAEHGLIGIASIGEQWGAVHRNQTLSGVIFG